MLSRAVVVAVAATLLIPATASAQGTFQVNPPTIVYTGDGIDQIAGFETATSIRFTRFGGVTVGGDCDVTLDQQSVDCPKAGVTSVVLNLGDGDDVASVSSNVRLPVIFNGGAGNDGLFGGGGFDLFDGGPGNDNIVSRDGRGEQVDCGAGLDTAISDDADGRVSCEEIEGDADGDGVRLPADCNDTTPAIRPGAIDIPDDRIDQDCSGADATDLDRDGDGSPRPQDCDDADRAVRPGAREVIGNGKDENCDTEVVPFPPIPGSLSNAWVAAGSRTRNVSLSAKDFPRRTAIRIRCRGRGCPSGSARRRVRGRAVNLHGFLGDRALARGARVEVTFTRPRRIGRVLRFRMRSPGVPEVDFLCKPPGRRARDC